MIEKKARKKDYIFNCYMRLLDLYDYLEVYTNNLTAELELNALEVICKIYEEEIEAMGVEQ